MEEYMNPDNLPIAAIILVVSLPALILLLRSKTMNSNVETKLDTIMIGLTIIAGLLSLFSLIFIVGTLMITYTQALGVLISNEWAMLAAVAGAPCLFRFRGSHPFFYGIGEVVVGILTTWAAIHSDEAALLAKAIGFFGGAYVMVRGFDNMDRGLPRRFRALWDGLFPKAISEAS